MAKFTSFDAPTGTPGPISVRRATATEFGGSGKGLQAAGESLQKFAGEMQAKNDREDITRVQVMQSTAVEDLSGAISQMEVKARAGSKEHITNVQGAVNAYYEARVDQATTEAGKQLLQRQHASVRSHFTKKAIIFQSASVGAKISTDLKEGLNKDKTTLYTDPSQSMFELTLSNRLDAINNPAGAIYANTNEDDRDKLSTEAKRELTKAQVQGLIRQDPLGTQIAIEAGVFGNDLNADDVKPLIAQAEQAVRGARAAESAARKVQKEQDKVVLDAERDNLFTQMTTGKDRDGNEVSVSDTTQNILDSPILPSFGVGSKNSMLKIIQLRAKGKTTEEFKASESAQQNIFLRAITTGKNADGSSVDMSVLKEAILNSDDLGVFGSGSKATLLKMADAAAAGVVTPLSRREQEIYGLVINGVDPVSGQELTREQLRQRINDDDLLPVDGAAGKKAFITMIDELDKADTTKTKGVNTNDYYARINLPRDDPKRMTPEDFMDPEVTRAIGFEKAERLRKVAQGMENATQNRLEKSVDEFVNRFKGSITKSILGSKLDSEGDDRFVSFREEMRERANKVLEEGGDPFALFNSGDARNYIGSAANKYSSSVNDVQGAVNRKLRGQIVPFVRPGATGVPAPATPGVDKTSRRVGESTDEYLKRQGKK